MIVIDFRHLNKGSVFMGKIFIAGEGQFKVLTTPEQAKKYGYISSSKVSNMVLQLLCDGTYENGGLEKQRKAISEIAEKLDKLQFGNGKSTRFYYKENEVMGYIGSIIHNNPLILADTLDIEKAKESGYISGTIVGNVLWRYLENHYGTALISSVYNREFKRLREVVEKKTIGTGKATKHYYLKTAVEKYIKEVLPNYL